MRGFLMPNLLLNALYMSRIMIEYYWRKSYLSPIYPKLHAVPSSLYPGLFYPLE